MKNKIPDHVTEELAKVGARIVDCGMGGRHPFVRYELSGLSRKHSWPGSSSDHRSMLNNRTELRRALRALGEEVAKKAKAA